ncbi:oligoendopeptidase F [Aeoliella sp. ICT_H6.2]|uniref:Oligopeptidase F n=1 Tax=Aeoliella straminimaris TaxID=2954799 RepID=A0A9X2FIY6_9BACT|nr:oligoendopeptidase F [Aeoliella straminimaris]MCO6046501.1 oligoendopeptidase F [Aeoliella straminimaris]
MATKKLPLRSKVKTADTWDLSTLFASDEEWETAFTKWQKQIQKYEKFRGTLGDGPAQLAKLLKFDSKFDQEGERIGTYAHLKTTEDSTNSTYQRMLGRFMNAASNAGQAASFIRPEILSLSAAKLKKYLAAKELAHFKLSLERLVRYKPHTLTDNEEKLLAMQAEMAQAAGQAFRQLTDADMKFGDLKNEKGETIELGHSSFSAFLNSPKRDVRKKAFHQFYAEFADHENTLAATLSGSIQRDVYNARVRNFTSAREASLFVDDVPVSVYDNLINAVHSKLPAVYKYFDVRRRKMKLKDIHHYDTYVPILSELNVTHTWNQAVKKVVESLAPLGDEYCSVLADGLKSARWCDRYPNKGKRSGAFSSGSFDGAPYILMNYQPDVLNHVFTLTHEAGHSMHTYYSKNHQPYEYYDYTIFVAEVASTFNEELLGKYLLDRAQSDKERAYLVNRAIDDIRGTIIRQTMFAEFEKVTHALAEAGEPLTLECLKQEYHKLLALYFGPDFALDPELDLECLRIPHFYSAFYVYKYATGMSAAIALSKRVLEGGQQELDDYLTFLKGGCSKYPLELLRDAGVDMEKPDPVQTALEHFESLVDQLDELL